jgi:alkylation response protein AidB-like acyl-CoA dehydrogenase
MDFAFSEEQELLRSSAREFLAEQYPLERVAELVDGEPGWPPQCWKQLADLGWLDAELGLLDHVVVFEETGYALLPAPLFSTLALALPALEHAGQSDTADPAGADVTAPGARGLGGAASAGVTAAGPAELRAAVAAGELRLTLVWAQTGRPQGLRDAASSTITVGADGALRGQAVLVPDATLVDAFVVATADGLRLARAAGAVVTPRATTDRSRRLADVTFDGTPSTPLVPAEGTPSALAATERRALVLAAAEALGVARRATEIAVDYARTREQFGKPIGTYQDVSHQIVDAYAATELARSLTYWAAWTVATAADGASDEQPPGQVDAACSAAKSSAAEAAVQACEHAIQVCGGVGFTWEHVLHRLYKRALWLELFAGPTRQHRARIADFVL